MYAFFLVVPECAALSVSADGCRAQAAVLSGHWRAYDRTRFQILIYGIFGPASATTKSCPVSHRGVGLLA